MMRNRSLRSQLLTWLLVPLLCVIAFNAWSGYLNACATAEVITDRMLLASARAMAEQIRVRDGGIEVLIPPVALEMFATDEKDHVAYSITGPDGMLLAGDPSFTMSANKPKNLQPVYSDATFRSERMRVVALRQPIASNHPNEAALVLVGETLHSYDKIASDMFRRNFFDQLLLVAAAGGLTWFGMNRGLLPLRRLSKSLVDRDPQLLETFSVSGLQTELKPLVVALNEALERVRKQGAIRRRFIADAAHQLRTPLTLLKTQASVGLREEDLKAAREALGAILISTDAMTRLTNQLLTLARADPDQGPAVRSEVDLAAIMREAVEKYSTLAAARCITLTAKMDAKEARIDGEPTLLRELIANLLDNAIKYTPEAGEVTVALRSGDGASWLRVEDSGVGIPLSEQEHVFKRFYRVLGTGVEGSGLGLSIVAEVARLHSAQLSLTNRSDVPGLCVEVRFPSIQAVEM